jgi:hypothetical protein
MLVTKKKNAAAANHKNKNKMKTKTKKHHKWSMKYKKSINCNRPRGFSQKQYCKYGRNKK